MYAVFAVDRRGWLWLDCALRPGRWPKLAPFMDESEHDVLAYFAFPPQHRIKLHSTNPLERLNKMGYPGRLDQRWTYRHPA